MSEEKESPQQGIQVRFPEQLRGGSYSNVVNVIHTKEEFVMDFMMIMPPVGTVNSRIIISPGHMKRMVAALQENIGKYESKFGEIKVAPEPKGKIGFVK